MLLEFPIWNEYGMNESNVEKSNADFDMYIPKNIVPIYNYTYL